MNVFKKALLAVALLVAANSASAIEVSFDFTVFSSGSSIYPCNAGIKHAKAQDVVCYERTNPRNSCNPNLCEEGKSCDCVCSGTDGSYLTDFASVKYTKWSDHDDRYPRRNKKASFAADGTKNFLFSNDVDMFGEKQGKYFDNQLSSLSFNLGSELFGTEYFLDVCYRGPQIDYHNAGIDTNWVAKAEATIQNLSDTYSSYANVAGLKVKSEIVCDYQNEVSYDVNETPGNEALDEDDSYRLIHNQRLGLNTGVANGRRNITGHGKKAPNFCRVRYTFTEGHKLSGKEQFRPWETQAAKICTRTSIEDPAL